MSHHRPPSRNEELLGLAIVFGIILFIDAILTTALIAVIAESQINLLHTFLTTVLSVLGAPLALLFGFELPRWVWVFIIVSWIGQPLILWNPFDAIIDSVIQFIVAAIIGFFGLILGGWGIERAVDTLVAIMMPISSGLSMTGENPFNFSAPELGVVAVGWIIVIFLIIVRDE